MTWKESSPPIRIPLNKKHFNSGATAPEFFAIYTVFLLYIIFFIVQFL